MYLIKNKRNQVLVIPAIQNGERRHINFTPNAGVLVDEISAPLQAQISRGFMSCEEVPSPKLESPASVATPEPPSTDEPETQDTIDED